MRRALNPHKVVRMLYPRKPLLESLDESGNLIPRVIISLHHIVVLGVTIMITIPSTI